MIRKTLLRRRSSKKRAYKTPRCSVRGCKRPVKVKATWGSVVIFNEQTIPLLEGGLCLSHAKVEADRRWAERVKADYFGIYAHEEVGRICALYARHRDTFPCSGPIQAAHGFSRRYLGTRYELLNGFALCAAAHTYWTHNPLAWDEVLRQEWGEAVYDELREKALRFVGPVDYAAVIQGLTNANG